MTISAQLKPRNHRLSLAIAAALGGSCLPQAVLADVVEYTAASATFTMIDPTGGPVGQFPDVTGSISLDDSAPDGVIGSGTFSVASTSSFFGFNWTAHDGVTFGPGTYTIDTIQGGTYTGIEVGPGQVGGHILFDWNTARDIDVVMVWDVTDNPDGSKTFTSTDPIVLGPNPNPDGVRGVGMIDGAFPGFNANFDITTETTVAETRPSVFDDRAITNPNVPVDIDVLANDVNTVAINPASVTVVGVPANGAAVANPDGTITYTPDPAFGGGEDSFTYTVETMAGVVSTPATVTVAVAFGNPPNVVDDSFSGTEDTPLTTGDVLANDTDADGDTLTVIGFTQPANGSVVNNNDGTFTFTPAADFEGETSFEYTVEDQGFNRVTGTVTLTIAAVNDPPVAGDDSRTAIVDTPLTINVLGNDNDVDGDTLTISAFTQPVNGSGSVTQVNNNGVDQLLYTPNAGFLGTDNFDYTVTDGNGESVTATVTVTVIDPVFNGPVAEDFQGAGGGEQISADITGGSSFIMIGGVGQNVGGTNDVQVQWDGTILVGQQEAEQKPAPTMQITSAGPTKFFNFVWSTSGVRVFGPGSYEIDTGCNERLAVDYTKGDGIVTPNPNFDPSADPDSPDSRDCIADADNLGGPKLKFTVGPEQLGAHMLFDWGNTGQATPCGLVNCAIDVAMVWDINHPWEGPVDGVEPFKATGTTFNLAVVDGDDVPDGFPGNRMVDGPFVGFSPNFNLNLNPAFHLPTLTLQANQGGNPVAVAGQAGGNVTLQTRDATGSTDVDGTPRPVNFTYDWNGSDPAILSAVSGGTTGNSLVFDPSGITGPVTARVTITEVDTRLQHTETLTLAVAATQELDSDDDGAPDGTESTPTEVVANTNLANSRVVSDLGTLRLGNISLANGADTGIFQAEVSDALPADAGVSDSCIGGCFDFVVRDITPGSTVNVVLPLSEPIPADAGYRKFFRGQWRNFRMTGTAPNALEGGTLASAPGGPGTCPAPVSTQYQPGLNEGDFCVRLTLIDGGLNDDDLVANGVIRDPGGVSGAAVAAATRDFSAGSPSSGSGCTLATTGQTGQRLDWWLVGAALGLLGWFRRRARRS